MRFLTCYASERHFRLENVGVQPEHLSYVVSSDALLFQISLTTIGQEDTSFFFSFKRFFLCV